MSIKIMPWFHKYQNKIKIYLNKLKGIFLLMRVNKPSQEGINTIIQGIHYNWKRCLIKQFYKTHKTWTFFSNLEILLCVFAVFPM